jgi:hypothetical protein
MDRVEELLAPVKDEQHRGAVAGQQSGGSSLRSRDLLRR